MAKQFQSLAAFYPYYLTEHQDKTCRVLHFIGTSFFFFFFFYAIITQKWSMLWFCPLSGYGFAWIGHFFFEKNKPATFQYPLYSLASDFIMYYHTLTFQISTKLTEAKLLFPSEK